MSIKHQQDCFRVINGEKLINYCDLIFSDEANEQVIAQAKIAYKTVRKIKNTAGGYYQLFVSDKKPIIAEFINVGRGKVSKIVQVKDTATLHKEIGKLLASKNWGMEETDVPGKYEITSGWRSVGNVIVTDPNN